MKKLAAGLLAALCINALALNVTNLLTPSPLGVIIAVRTYFKDQKKVYHIRVESQARDFEQAKKQAFRLASEQVAGTVVLSESELRNGKLTRDEVITYSSGLIDQYKIIDRFDSNDSVKLTMDIWIAESVMAQRLLAKSATERGIAGAELSVRAESILDERQRGDNIFRAVLNDFPLRAFVVKTTPPLIQMDPYRNTNITVQWDLSWDNRYFDAFYDAAKQTGRKPCVLWGCSPNQKFFVQGWEFDDIQKLHMTIDRFQGSDATVMVELQDIHGRAVARTCDNLGNLYPLFIVRNNQIDLNGKDTVRGRSKFRIGQNTAVMASLENIRVEVVTGLQCRIL
jgi:hypothetical protein